MDYIQPPLDDPERLAAVTWLRDAAEVAELDEPGSRQAAMFRISASGVETGQSDAGFTRHSAMQKLRECFIEDHGFDPIYSFVDIMVINRLGESFPPKRSTH